MGSRIGCRRQDGEVESGRGEGITRCASLVWALEPARSGRFDSLWQDRDSRVRGFRESILSREQELGRINLLCENFLQFVGRVSTESTRHGA